mmetsp:Transcript_62428/g.136488  ORF Transcript_62428/g.136488 Transcript_62428/m.136488 type:complete len:224 (-) Transcript_62428:29-700(-)
MKSFSVPKLLAARMQRRVEVVEQPTSVTTNASHSSVAPIFGFPEVVAAATMLAPSLVALLLTPDDASVQVDLMSLGAAIHCPFSMMLHIHRAYGRCAHTRGVLHRFDVSFIHVHAMITNLAWRADLGTYEAVGILLNVASIVALFTSCHAKNQINAPLWTAACVVWSAAYIFVLNQVLGICAYLGWALAFGVFFLKPCGIYTPAVFHLLLALPQACIVTSVVR